MFDEETREEEFNMIMESKTMFDVRKISFNIIIKILTVFVPFKNKEVLRRETSRGVPPAT